jgi:uncharacterized protein (DUF849 family)
MASHKFSCAVAGSIHTPSTSPPLPVTPAEIAESALSAAVVGTKAQQVKQVGDIIEGLGVKIATGRGKRHFSSSKGSGDNVAF